MPHGRTKCFANPESPIQYPTAPAEGGSASIAGKVWQLAKIEASWRCGQTGQGAVQAAYSERSESGYWQRHRCPRFNPHGGPPLAHAALTGDTDLMRAQCLSGTLPSNMLIRRERREAARAPFAVMQAGVDDRSPRTSSGFALAVRRREHENPVERIEVSEILA